MKKIYYPILSLICLLLIFSVQSCNQQLSDSTASTATDEIQPIDSTVSTGENETLPIDSEEATSAPDFSDTETSVPLANSQESETVKEPLYLGASRATYYDLDSFLSDSKLDSILSWWKLDPLDEGGSAGTDSIGSTRSILVPILKSPDFELRAIETQEFGIFFYYMPPDSEEEYPWFNYEVGILAKFCPNTAFDGVMSQLGMYPPDDLVYVYNELYDTWYIDTEDNDDGNCMYVQFPADDEYVMTLDEFFGYFDFETKTYTYSPHEVIPHDTTAQQTEKTTEPQTEPQTEPETQPTTQPQPDVGLSPASIFCESTEEFLNLWWTTEEIPNSKGVMEDTVVVPVLNLESYNLHSVRTSPRLFIFYYQPIGYDIITSVPVTIIIERQDVAYETGTFDRSFPYSNVNERTWCFLAYHTNPRVTFPESVYPQTEEELEKVITFELHTRPETTTTADAETDAVP